MNKFMKKLLESKAERFSHEEFIQESYEGLLECRDGAYDEEDAKIYSFIIKAIEKSSSIQQAEQELTEASEYYDEWLENKFGDELIENNGNNEAVRIDSKKAIEELTKNERLFYLKNEMGIFGNNEAVREFADYIDWKNLCDVRLFNKNDLEFLREFKAKFNGLYVRFRSYKKEWENRRGWNRRFTIEMILEANGELD